MRVALDAMGGDDAPDPNIDGAINAVQKSENLHVVLVGDPAVLQPKLAATGFTSDRITISESDGVVEMHEKPMVALRSKPSCSIAVCWKLMANKDVDAIVSAGNTGAVVAAGLRTRLFLKGVKRPGIAVTLPNLKGQSVLIDAGANPAAKPEHLYQHAIMGSIYCREILGIESPRIGLLNIGSEDGKGNELHQGAHALLQDSVLKENYIGNVEGRGVYLGEADVLICDGFTGNMILKVSEGMASFLLKTVGKALVEGLQTEQQRAGEILREVAKTYEYQESGGAPLMGIDGNCMICHGSSDAHSIANALRMAETLQAHHINDQIVEHLGA